MGTFQGLPDFLGATKPKNLGFELTVDLCNLWGWFDVDLIKMAKRRVVSILRFLHAIRLIS